MTSVAHNGIHHHSALETLLHTAADAWPILGLIVLGVVTVVISRIRNGA